MIMKTIMLLISLTFLCMSPMKHAAAQSTEAAQLLLNVEKLAQFKQILKDMKKGIKSWMVAIIRSKILPKVTSVSIKSSWTA